MPRIENLASTYIIADFLILTTIATMIVIAALHIKDKGSEAWGSRPQPERIVYDDRLCFHSFEGINVVLLITDVAVNPKQFPKILLLVIMT